MFLLHNSPASSPHAPLAACALRRALRAELPSQPAAPQLTLEDDVTAFIAGASPAALIRLRFAADARRSRVIRAVAAAAAAPAWRTLFGGGEYECGSESGSESEESEDGGEGEGEREQEREEGEVQVVMDSFRDFCLVVPYRNARFAAPHEAGARDPAAEPLPLW